MTKLLLLPLSHMRKLGIFELLGPIALFLALAVADGAVYALQWAPSCAWLWRVNLKYLGVFQRTHYAFQGLTGGDYPQLLFVATPLLVAAGIGYFYRRSLLLALSSNLSFIYILFVAIVSEGFHPVTQASLASGLSVGIPPDVLILAPLVGICLVSFVVSHALYFVKVRAGPA